MSRLAFDIAGEPTAVPVTVLRRNLSLAFEGLSDETPELTPDAYYVIAALPSGEQVMEWIEVGGEITPAKLSSRTQHDAVRLLLSSWASLDVTAWSWPAKPISFDQASVTVTGADVRIALRVAGDARIVRVWLGDASCAAPVEHDGGLKLQVVARNGRLELRPVVHPAAQSILDYLGRGDVANGKLLTRVLEAEHLLEHKVHDPIAAAVGAYALLATQDLDRLHDWTQNLCNWFEWLPDGAAIHAEFLARTGDHEAAADVMLKLADRGAPMFRPGLLFALDRLRDDQRPAAHELRERLSKFARGARADRGWLVTEASERDVNKPVHLATATALAVARTYDAEQLEYLLFSLDSNTRDAVTWLIASHREDVAISTVAETVWQSDPSSSKLTALLATQHATRGDTERAIHMWRVHRQFTRSPEAHQFALLKEAELQVQHGTAGIGFALALRGIRGRPDEAELAAELAQRLRDELRLAFQSANEHRAFETLRALPYSQLRDELMIEAVFRMRESVDDARDRLLALAAAEVRLGDPQRTLAVLRSLDRELAGSNRGLALVIRAAAAAQRGETEHARELLALAREAYPYATQSPIAEFALAELEDELVRPRQQLTGKLTRTFDGGDDE